MLKNWNLQELRQNGIKYESAAAGEEGISGEALNKLSSKSYRSIKKNNSPKKKTTIKRNATNVVYLSSQIM